MTDNHTEEIRVTVPYEKILSAVLTCGVAAHMEKSKAAERRMMALLSDSDADRKRYERQAQDAEEAAERYRNAGRELENAAIASAMNRRAA